MEFLEGQTLADEIGGKPVEIEKLLALAIEIADGLEAAHAKEHRPPGHQAAEPLRHRARARPRILDFGLAKLKDSAGGTKGTSRGLGRAPDQSRESRSAPLAYMSPEQVRGEALDARTDIFSFGAVLYEMATGAPPFKGESSGALFNEIINKAPASPVRLNPEVPDGLERVIRKCLEKDRDLRYQHASDLRADLKRLRRDTTSGQSMAHSVASPAGRRRSATPWVVAAALAVAGALGWWLVSGRGRDIPAPPPKIVPFTTDGGWKSNPRLSPDGEKVAYEWRGDIYVKAIGIGTRPLQLTEDEAQEVRPVWSPDGRQIAFVRVLEEGAATERSAIYTVPSLRGQERKLIDIEGPGRGDCRILSSRSVLVAGRPVAGLRREGRAGRAGPDCQAVARHAGEGASDVASEADVGRSGAGVLARRETSGFRAVGCGGGRGRQHGRLGPIGRRWSRPAAHLGAARPLW